MDEEKDDAPYPRVNRESVSAYYKWLLDNVRDQAKGERPELVIEWGPEKSHD